MERVFKMPRLLPRSIIVKGEREIHQHNGTLTVTRHSRVMFTIQIYLLPDRYTEGGSEGERSVPDPSNTDYVTDLY